MPCILQFVLLKVGRPETYLFSLVTGFLKGGLMNLLPSQRNTVAKERDREERDGKRKVI